MNGNQCQLKTGDESAVPDSNAENDGKRCPLGHFTSQGTGPTLRMLAILRGERSINPVYSIGTTWHGVSWEETWGIGGQCSAWI